MTPLRQKMIRELELHRKSPRTVEAWGGESPGKTDRAWICDICSIVDRNLLPRGGSLVWRMMDTFMEVLRWQSLNLCLIAVRSGGWRSSSSRMKAAAAKTGAPRAIISDKGSDLHCGIDLFRHRHLGATVQNVRRRITQALAAEQRFQTLLSPA